MIDPSIPAAWDGYTVNRVFRGDTYNITVKNPNHVCTGVSELIVDGIKVEGNIIPYYNDGKSHSVEVVLG